MKILLYVLKNYKQAYKALMTIFELENVIEVNKGKAKKGPTFLYGKIGQVTVEYIRQFNEEEK